MDNLFYKVDLHVHTPASKCYVGDKSEDGYWKILESAAKNNIKVIAITDHNTLSGYESLMKLKEETQKEYSIIQKYNISSEEKKEIEDKVELFNKVCIILGVEITLNPGVHIIVLCEESEKSDLDDLLDEVGFSSDKRGADEEMLPNMDVKKFLENPRLHGKIVLAPHVDSDKGIWKVLSGQYRAEIFKSTQIDAITCNSASQLTKIQGLVCSQPEYIRKKPFAYINASDAHEQSKVGAKHSFFKLKDFNFQEIKKAIGLPEEYISDTEKPEFLEFVEKCSKSNPTIFLDKLEDLSKAICAVLNNGYGCILLGIKDNSHLAGIDIDCKQLEAIIKENLKKIETVNRKIGKIEDTIKTEKLGNGKCSCVLLIKYGGGGLWIYDENESYILNSNTYKLATIKDIEQLIRNHIISELQEFNSVNNEIISDTVNKMKHVLHPISKFKIFTKIESISVPLTYYFEVKFHNPLNIKNFDDPSKYGINGSSKGNVYYTEMKLPRLDDSYLRYSCPTYFSKDEQFISQLFVLNSSAICITISGGCHLIDNADTCYFGSPVPTLLFLPKETFYEDKLSIKHVIAWLKSNISLWVQLQKTGSSDFINPRTIDNMLLPYGSDFYKNNSILELVNKILNLEQVFLQQSHQFNNQKNNTSSNSTEDLCIKHNNTVNKIAYEIEETIRNFVGITDEENELIYSDLNADNVYLYNKEG